MYIYIHNKSSMSISFNYFPVIQLLFCIFYFFFRHSFLFSFTTQGNVTWLSCKNCWMMESKGTKFQVFLTGCSFCWDFKASIYDFENLLFEIILSWKMKYLKIKNYEKIRWFFFVQFSFNSDLITDFIILFLIQRILFLNCWLEKLSNQTRRQISANYENPLKQFRE